MGRAMIPSDRIERASAVRIEDETERRGIKVIGQIDRCGPCPLCGGRDRFSINIRKQVFNCRGCGARGTVIALVQALDGCAFREAVECLTGEHGPAPRCPTEASQRAPQLHRDDGRTRALHLWNAGADPRGTLVERYLASRGLELGDGIAGEVLRWHPGIRAMLGLFRDIRSDEPRAISRTFMDQDGRKIERKFLGPVGGCAIKLDDDDEVTQGLHVGEGVETCLAARQLGLRPTWALGSAVAVAAFPVLGRIECLMLLAEHCAVNARAVEQCAARWHEAGREVFIIEPKRGKDLNDAIRLRP
jgi:Toprim domain/CHC2 zinc finger